MALKVAHTRIRSISTAVALAALCCCSLSLPASVAAATPGGTAPAGEAGGAAKALTPTRASGAVGPHVTTIRITSVKCAPAGKCTGNPHQVSTRGTLLFGGIGLKAGMTVAFPRWAGARIAATSPTSHLRQTPGGLQLTVPSNAHSGHIMVLLGGSRHTSSYGPIYVYRHALHPPKPKQVTPTTATTVGAVSGTAFDGQGMWIWYLSASENGNLAAIVARAHAAGVTTLFVKSSDGASNYWSQFSPQLVQELHANGLRVCAWQYVYGSNPAGEAGLGARAVANGADCLVIDAESQYEGHYAAAQTYMTDLRAKVGASYPIGLASFPYVSYHPALPYSVFLGPNGAQYNAPQMYWKDIGVSVDTVYANTYIGNRIYGRPIFPLGQTYGGVSGAEVLRFREEAAAYGAPGESFWDWQETPASGWGALASPLAPLSSVTPNGSYPELSSGSKGDQVLWLQEHLASAIPTQEVTGVFGAQTTANLRAFQASHSIAVSGRADAPTWVALLALPPVAVNWTGGGPGL